MIDGYKNAKRQAQYYCSLKKRSVKVIKEGYRFLGKTSIVSYKKRLMREKMGKGFRHSKESYTQKKEMNMKLLSGLQGDYGDVLLEKGYIYKMYFQCRESRVLKSSPAIDMAISGGVLLPKSKPKGQ